MNYLKGWEKKKIINLEFWTLWNLQKWRGNKDFLKSQKPRESVASRLALHEVLEEALQREGKWFMSEMQISIKKGRASEKE